MYTKPQLSKVNPTVCETSKERETEHDEFFCTTLVGQLYSLRCLPVAGLLQSPLNGAGFSSVCHLRAQRGQTCQRMVLKFQACRNKR